METIMTNRKKAHPVEGHNMEGVNPAKKSGILKRSQAAREPEVAPIAQAICDGLDIPDFLRRQKDGSVKPTRAKAQTKVVAPKPAEPEVDPLDLIEDVEFRTFVEREIKAGRFQKKWLEGSDASTQLAMLQAEFGGKRAKKEEGLARLAEYKETHKKPPKPRQAYAEDAMYIASFDQANPRREGSANHAKYEGFKKYMAEHPSATVLEVVSKSGFYRNDLMWDVKQGRIKLSETSPVKAQLAKNIAAIEKEADAKVARAKAKKGKKK
jgi:hypothetical protein